MSEYDTRMPACLHRTWPSECVGIRAATSRELAGALRAAAGRASEALTAGTEFAGVGWSASVEPGAGPWSAAVVSDSAEGLIDRLHRAADAADQGLTEIADDGVYADGRSHDADTRVVWLFDGAAQVAPGMFGELGLRLPGVTRALDAAIQGDADPGRLAEYLYGPGEAPDLDSCGRARLAIGAARAMTEWLLRLLPHPWRAIGGPGGGRPWLETEKLSPATFCDDLLPEVAAPGEWEPTLRRLRDEGATRFVHAGPGAPAFIHADVIALQADKSSELRGLLHGLARVISAGVPVDLRPLYTVRGLGEKTAGAASGKHRGARMVFQPRSPRFDARAVTPPAAAAATSAPPSSPPESHDPRTGVVLEHLQTMQQFLEQQQRAMHSIMGRESPVAATTPPSSVLSAPMLDRLLEHQPGRRLVAAARFDVHDAHFLRQHTPNVSAVSNQDPTAFGLAAMPLTFSMEILAEAAAELVPGGVVIGFEELVAERWMTFEQDVVDVVVEANLVGRGASTSVETLLRSARDATLVYLKGRVLLDSAYPAAPTAEPLTIPNGRHCGWDLKDIYPRCGFHGPMLQAITAIDDHGDAGMTGELTVLPRGGLLASHPNPAFRLDPVLLDALGTGVGVWMWPEAMQGVYPVPYKVARIQFYGPPCPEGERLRMDVRLNQRDVLLLDADLTAVRSDGTVHAHVSGWQDYVYRLPLSIHRIMSDPFGQSVADLQTWMQGNPGWDDVAITTFPALGSGFFETGDGVWEKILAWYALAPPERRQWLSMMDQTQRRRGWLMGRITAKDAIRGLLTSRGIVAGHYDVHIDRSAEGRPYARGPWDERLPGGIAISLAHAGETALAVAGELQRGMLGIDMEHPSAMNEEVAECTFSMEERDRLTALDGDPMMILTRGWCAKEAVAKALGTGLRHDPRALTITAVGTGPAVVRVKLTGPWATEGRQPTTEVDVYLFEHGDQAVALCRIP